MRTHVWKRVCLDCWVAAKEATDGPFTGTKQKAYTRHREHTEAKRDHPFTEDFFNRFYQPPSNPAPAPAIDREMLRRLIQLCHPDKHAGSVASNTATLWLLSLK